MSISREFGPLKWNLNSILTISGVVVAVVTQIITFTIMWNNNSRDIGELKDKISDLTKTQTDMQTQIAAYTPLSYQVTQAITLGTENKEANKQTNIRIDRVVDTMTGKLDNVLDGLNKLNSSVAVLSSRIDNNNNPVKKSVEPIKVPYRP